ncbi:uncharacterized protein LOC131858321 [Cryptomeria japonica]|uniref:uncharacterized protein LOC131858321 n=1 Tax=Cryptomeria japonica TaxID=3369 RepID=UPI0027DA6AFF|nr:uncharacterized protein LOC131858321 [Cryptomeria japonica]
MAVLNEDESKMAKDFRRQPDWVLQKLGIQRDIIQTPKSGGIEDSEGGRPVIPKCSPPHMRRIEKPFITFDNPLLNGIRRWRDVHKDQSEENNTNRGNIINNNRGSNRYGSNQNNGNNGNNGNNDDNCGNSNGGGRNNNNRNGGNHGNNDNNNGGGNNGNNGNYGRNGGFSRGNVNNQNNNQGSRWPMIIEKYRQLDFTGIVDLSSRILVNRFAGALLKKMELSKRRKAFIPHYLWDRLFKRLSHSDSHDNNRKTNGFWCEEG